MTLSQMKEHQRLAIEEREKQIALKLAEDKRKTEKERKRKEKEKKRLKKYSDKNKISFGDDEDEEQEVIPKRKRFGKDLTVDTSFLPDDGKDEREREEREALRQEWLLQQDKLKNQTLGMGSENERND